MWVTLLFHDEGFGLDVTVLGWLYHTVVSKWVTGAIMLIIIRLIC